MNDFEKIEHLLLSKRFEELSPTEVKEVNGYFENASDYNDMRDTLMQVKSTLAADKLLIKPSVDLKEKLLQQFDKTYTNQAPSTPGKSRPFYKNIGFQWAAAASVVVIVSLSIFGYINNIGGKKSNEMAMDYKSNKTILPDEQPSSITETGTGNTTSPDVVTEESKTDGKEKVSSFNRQEIGSESNNDQLDKKAIYSNYFVAEDEVTEGIDDKTTNAPMVTTNSNNENNLNGFSITDNTTLGGTYTNVTKEEKMDADRVLTNAYRDDNTNKNTEDLKNGEQNTTINNQYESQYKGNTTLTINKDQTTKKDYWTKKKNSKKKSNNTNTENTNIVSDKDSVLTRTDSLKVDSNKSLYNNNGSIQMQDNKKDE